MTKLRYIREEIVISTIKVPFMQWYGEYETTLSFDFGRSWRVICGYSNRKEAVLGHESYSKMSSYELNGLHEMERL